MRNAVCRSVLAEAEADERVRETLRFYQSRSLRFSWVVGPETRPRDMGGRLLAAGFRLYTADCGMTAALHELPSPTGSTETGPRVVLEPLVERNIDAWLHIQRAVWDLPLELAARMREARRRRDLGADHGILEYVVRVGETPVGITAIHVFDEFAHLCTSAVLPEFRNRGIFQSVVRERLGVVRALGRSFVTVHAIQRTSAPIYRKLGFRWDCDFTYYVR